MKQEDREILDSTVQQVADHVEDFKKSHKEILKGVRPVRITINAGGLGTTLVLLILISVLLGFAYIRTQTRLDGLYDRLDAIYMMAPQLKQETSNEHHHPHAAAQGQQHGIVHQP